MLERLQKIISRAGIASRRHAEELISGGQVRVNGEVITELGAKANPETDRVEVAGKLAEIPAEPSYYMLHKPVNVVATMSDPEGRGNLRHLLRGLTGVFPVGRLDYAASGLLLLTNDGELANRIFKISASMPKVYWLKIKGRPSADLLSNLRHTAHAHLRLLDPPDAAKKDADNPWYEAELGDARRDLLRSSLFAAGHPVEKLKRVKLGPLHLADLPEAHYRKLDPTEVTRLREAVARAEKAPHTVRPPGKGRDPGNRRFKRLREAPKSQPSESYSEAPPPRPTAPTPFRTPFQKPFGQPYQKPAAESGSSRPTGDRPFRKPFSKPFDKRGAVGGSSRPTGDRPFRKPFSKPFDKRGAAGGSSRPTGDRPFRKPFSKPFDKRGAAGGSSRPTGDRPFRKPFSKPFDKRGAAGGSSRPTGDRPFRKPFSKPFDKRGAAGGSSRPTGDRPFRKPFSKPFDKRGAVGGSSRPTGDRPFRKPFSKPFDKRGAAGGSSRPTGDRPFRKPFSKPFDKRGAAGGSSRPSGGKPFRKPFRKPGGDFKRRPPQ